MNKKSILVSAAVAGMLGAALSASPAMAKAKGGEKGHCVGANACKGKTGCAASDGSNACKGQNGCKAKGWLEMSKAKCDKMAKKNKAIKFEAAPASKS